jgi:hypothetical protein
MAAAAGQAAGLAVGAAIGSIIPGIGTLAGGAIGAGAAGLFQQQDASGIQTKLDTEALQLNREQARLKAAESSAIHAANFRQALASQISSAAMRGGTGSLVSQFGHQAYASFLRDQRAIEAGLAISEAQADITQAGITAQKTSRDISALTRFGQTSFTGINLNLLQPRS